jgi:hypothetical protein
MLAAFISAGGFSASSGQAAAQGSSAVSAKEVFYRWRVAQGHGDTSFIEKLLSADYVGVTWREKTLSRADSIAASRKQPRNADVVARATSEFVQLFGNHASVHALVSEHLNGEVQRVLWSADFVYRHGRWQVFYSQQTLVADAVADAAVLTLSGVTGGNSPAPQTCDSPADEADANAWLPALRHRWLAAEIRGDADFLACLLAPDYNDVDYHGKSRNREALIDYSKKHADADKPVPPSVPQIVTIDGDSAVVRNLWTGQLNGKTARIWLADTFVRDNGRWRAIYSQQTLVRE